MTIVYVAEKGQFLTIAEFDGNFRDLADRVAALELSPPTAVSIDHFVVEGTLMTIVMSNGDEHGPFVLPTATWRWTGEYQAGVTYLAGDLLTNLGDVYFVRVMHVAPTVFDPSLFTVDGFAYVLVISKALQPYDIGLYLASTIGGGSEVLLLSAIARDLTIPANFETSIAYLRVATSETPIVLPIYKNEADIIGTLTFIPGDQLSDSGGQFGTFNAIEADTEITLVRGDRLSISQPYEDDPTAEGLSVTFATITTAV